MQNKDTIATKCRLGLAWEYTQKWAASPSWVLNFPSQCRYMLPALSLIPSEAEECVRVEYAGILAQLAATAHRFLMRLQGTPAQQVCHHNGSATHHKVRQ